VSNAIIASRYYLETELKDKIIEEIDIFVNYAIAESTNRVFQRRLIPLLTPKPADMSVMILVEEIRKIFKKNEFVLDSDFETDSDSESDRRRRPRPRPDSRNIKVYCVS
jgi:predicted metal-dependent TIM-barrel fold hydrolase